jgi:hypothetical protein
MSQKTLKNKQQTLALPTTSVHADVIQQKSPPPGGAGRRAVVCPHQGLLQ